MTTGNNPSINTATKNQSSISNNIDHTNNGIPNAIKTPRRMNNSAPTRNRTMTNLLGKRCMDWHDVVGIPLRLT